jgi:mannose-1-phosphate guanylyltransferase/phosphomannomutase
MIAVVMAGGEGTRLRPITCRRPKPMAEVVNRPLMEHFVRLLVRQGVTTAYATLHYLADEIESYFEDGSAFGVSMRYSVEDSPLGTAGSIKRLESELRETFLVVSGDALTDFDLAKAAAFHRDRGAAATIVLARVPQPLEFGVVITNGGEGRIVRFLEKPGWGEVFSDTVNTGIYVLEPEVLRRIPPDRPTDFSRDVFPAMLAEGESLYGYVASGYWSDVGSLAQYVQANVDALQGTVKVEIPGEEAGDRIWVGAGTRIHSGGTIEGPLVIGRKCLIGEHVGLLGPCSIGDYCVVEPGAQIERSIILKGAYIGRGSHIRGAIIGADAMVKSHGMVAEGAVVGDACLLGEGTRVEQDVKIWPNKVTETGARVTMSLIWGTKWPGALFSGPGVRGLANLEITPEFAAKLASAFGATLEHGVQVITSRDIHPVSRMTKRAMIAGLMSVGVNVLDLRTMPAPIARHAALVSGAAGGIHVSLWASNPDEVLIEFFDSQGRSLGRAEERNVEGVFFRGDYRRSHREEVGSLDFLGRAVEAYTTDFRGCVNTEAIRAAHPRIVVDYSFGALAMFMPMLLGRLGCEAIGLNTFVDPTHFPISWEKRRRDLGHLSDIVTAYRAHLGVLIDGQGERMAVVDEAGRPVSGDDLLNIMTYLAVRQNGGGIVAVPVTAPAEIETTCAALGGECVRTKADRRSLAEACGAEGVLFGGDPRGGFIFPEMQPALDAMISLGKLLEMLVREQASLSCVKEALPPVHKVEQSVECPWERKGEVMRRLHDEVAASGASRVEHVDGLKLWFDGSWVLVLPDASTPQVHVLAEGGTSEEAQALLDDYVSRVSSWASG